MLSTASRERSSVKASHIDETRSQIASGGHRGIGECWPSECQWAFVPISLSAEWPCIIMRPIACANRALRGQIRFRWKFCDPNARHRATRPFHENREIATPLLARQNATLSHLSPRRLDTRRFMSRSTGGRHSGKLHGRIDVMLCPGGKPPHGGADGWDQES